MLPKWRNRKEQQRIAEERSWRAKQHPKRKNWCKRTPSNSRHKGPTSNKKNWKQTLAKLKIKHPRFWALVVMKPGTNPMPVKAIDSSGTTICKHYIMCVQYQEYSEVGQKYQTRGGYSASGSTAITRTKRCLFMCIILRLAISISCSWVLLAFRINFTTAAAVYSISYTQHTPLLPDSSDQYL